MEISIFTPKISFTCDLKDYQVADLLMKAMAYAIGSECVPQSDDIGRPVPVSHIEEATTHDIRDLQKTRTNPEKEGYKGLLYIKCEKCGAIKGYCGKSPSRYYRCDRGHITILENLKVLYVNCACGCKLKYRTNLTEDTHTMTCMSCGQPVELEYNDKRGMCQTMGYNARGEE